VIADLIRAFVEAIVVREWCRGRVPIEAHIERVITTPSGWWSIRWSLP
jgi:hypothetical protein